MFHEFWLTPEKPRQPAVPHQKGAINWALWAPTSWPILSFEPLGVKCPPIARVLPNCGPTRGLPTNVANDWAHMSAMSLQSAMLCHQNSRQQNWKGPQILRPHWTKAPEGEVFRRSSIVSATWRSALSNVVLNLPNLGIFKTTRNNPIETSWKQPEPAKDPQSDHFPSVRVASHR